MNKFSKRVLYSAASAVAVASIAGAGAYAQEAEAVGEEATKTLDTVVVTGIRASISKSLTDKRDAKNIVDTINAEDIGKSTDQNIAEAMNRISGVSISLADGEGSQISIRGSSPNQNVITLNGAALGSTGENQAVDLSQFSADILGKIEVIKTPSADHEEGSLGGLVNLTTRKPLDIDRNVRNFGLQGRYGDQSGAADYKFSGTVSQKFFDDKFGVLLSVVDETNTVRRDSMNFGNWDTFRSFSAQDTLGNEYISAPADVANGGNSYAEGNAAIYGIAPRNISYTLQEGGRDRQSADLALQWRPTEKTDISMNFSHSRQQIDNETDGMFFRSNDNIRAPNYLGAEYGDHNLSLPVLDTEIDPEDQIANGGDGLPDNFITSPLVDPSSWQIINTETRTWEKVLKRFEGADLVSSANRFENRNTTASFEVNHEFTDWFKASVGASYQEAVTVPDLQVSVRLQARQSPSYLMAFLAPDEAQRAASTDPRTLNAPIAQPGGWDCTSGFCLPIGTETPVDLGTLLAPPTQAELDEFTANGQTGTIGNPLTTSQSDNILVSMANPDDIFGKALGNPTQTRRDIKDTQEVFFADFDVDFDRFGFTTFEFGGKYTKREKFVDTQQGLVTNLNSAATVINPATGEPVQVSNALDQTPLGGFQRWIAPEGFLEGLGAPGDNIVSNGFMSVDPEAIFSVIAGDPDLAITVDDSETRSAEFENFAGYLKTNFSFFDDRLTGDVGVRYVKTKLATEGFGGLSTFSESFGRNQRIWDPKILRTLTDTSLPACPDNWNYPTGGIAQGDIYRFSRIDGNGVDTLGTADWTDDIRIADQGACHEPILASWDTFLNTADRTILRRHNNTFFTNNDFFNFDDDPSNGEGFITNADGSLGAPTDNTIQSFKTSGEHEYDLWLPSFNLNYLVRDDFITRFAVSKTMTRPQIDLLRPGIKVREAGWGNPSTRRNNVDLFNTQLEPLESKNLDLSFEWYFERDALLSVGLFYKDLTNIEERETQQTYLRDLRTELQNGQDITTEGLILQEDQINFDNCYTTILGEWQVNYNRDYIEEMLFGDDPSALCATFNTSRYRNAAGGEVKGAEFQYSQNYSFLPGIFSGLGINANYTYTDSAFEQEESTLSPGEILPSFPIPRTPEHSYNVTAYWQMDGHQARLAYGGASDVLVSRLEPQNGLGSVWEEGRETLDFSASYAMSDIFTMTFEAVNLLDQPVRTYFTSRSVQLPEDPTGTGPLVDFDEGSPLADGAYKGRTLLEYNTGTLFRLGVRAEF